jgi:hypothetical protein
MLVYSVTSVGDVFERVVHLFGFGEEAVDSAFLLYFLALHVGELEELVAEIVDGIEFPLHQ